MSTILESPFNHFTSIHFHAGEGCDADNPCPEGDVCIEGKCHQKCGQDSDCPSHQDCRSDLYDNQQENICGEPLQGEVVDLIETIQKNVTIANNTKTSEEPQNDMMLVWGSLAVGVILLGGGWFWIYSNRSKL